MSHIQKFLVLCSFFIACSEHSMNNSSSTHHETSNGELDTSLCLEACKDWSSRLFLDCQASSTAQNSTCKASHSENLSFCNSLKKSECTQELLDEFSKPFPNDSSGSESTSTGGTFPDTTSDSTTTSTTDESTSSTSGSEDPSSSTTTCSEDCAPQCQELEEPCSVDEDCCGHESKEAFCILGPKLKKICVSTTDYGKCGWNTKFSDDYYTCEYLGATPGLADPSNQHPIHCPSFILGEPCNDMSFITVVGCCIPGGYRIFCDPFDKVIIAENCSKN